MDVLYLWPHNQCPQARTVLEQLENLKHIELRSPPSSYLPDVPRKLSPCIRVSVPAHSLEQGVRWSFTFASSPDADVFLPPLPDSEPIMFTFAFGLPSIGTGDEPALLMQERAGPGGAAVVLLDPMNKLETRQKRMDRVLNHTRFIKEPALLQVGRYSFEVSVPDPPADYVRLKRYPKLRRISYPMDEHENDWRTIDHHLGSGTYGNVELVQGMRSGAVRAVKTIMRKDEDGNDLTATIRDEVTIMKSLRHSLISTNSGFGSRYALIVAKHTSAALAYMHAKNIAHRDIKPENILWRFADVGGSSLTNPVKIAEENPSLRLHFFLTDFGFSREVTRPHRSVLGTPGFMAPEIRTRSTHTSAVDLYALGATWMLVCEYTATKPFHQKFLAGWSTNSYAQALHAFAATRGETYPLWTWISHMIHPDPLQRPQADQVRDMLEGVSELALVPDFADRLPKDSCTRSFTLLNRYDERATPRGLNQIGKVLGVVPEGVQVAGPSATRTIQRALPNPRNLQKRMDQTPAFRIPAPNLGNVCRPPQPLWPTAGQRQRHLFGPPLGHREGQLAKLHTLQHVQQKLSPVHGETTDPLPTATILDPIRRRPHNTAAPINGGGDALAFTTAPDKGLPPATRVPRTEGSSRGSAAQNSSRIRKSDRRGRRNNSAEKTKWRVILGRIKRVGKAAMAIKQGVKGFAGLLAAILASPEKEKEQKKKVWKLSQIKVPGAYVSFSAQG
ncbi:hypothetical protein ANO11243_056060 [Dothideomycetidae sp. 11243]|nr:hypothetical protein ANO11243_056060 [fungal sp. No.11243]